MNRKMEKEEKRKKRVPENGYVNNRS